MILDMAEHHKMLKENKINLIYSGPLWAEGIGTIAGTIKRRMEFDQLPLSASQEIFSVFVEQMNNMLMYSAEKEKFEMPGKKIIESPKGTFILGKEGKKYFIQTGNVMKNETVELVKNKIDHLNTLDKTALRKYYKEQMRLGNTGNTNQESKGAGLGFIEIARRISSKIEYSFTPYSEGLTFFTMYVMVGGDF